MARRTKSPRLSVAIASEPDFPAHLRRNVSASLDGDVWRLVAERARAENLPLSHTINRMLRELVTERAAA